MQIPTAIDPNSSKSENHFTGCRWFVFDAVGTLIEPSPPVAVAYHQIATRYGSQLSIDEVGRRFRSAFRASDSDGFPGGPIRGSLVSNDAIEVARWRWIVGEVFSEISDKEGCFHELWDHFALPASWRCFDDVGDALRRLNRAGLRLAIASNFDRRLHPVCDALPELAGIEHRVVSAEVGCRKPVPQFYASVIAACGCRSDEILMIGDNDINDVQGPKTAGMRALHLERRRAPAERIQLGSLSQFVEQFIDSSYFREEP